MPDFSFPLDDVLAAITPNTRVVFLTNPNNPTGVVDAARGDPRRSPRRVPPARSCSSTKRTPSSPASASSPSSTRFRTSSSAGRSRRRSAWPACGSAASSARRTTLDPIRLAVPVYSVNIAAVGGDRRRRSTISITCNDYLRAGRASRRRCSTPPAIASACGTWKSAVELRAGPRRRPHRRAGQGRARAAASTCAIARPSRAAPAASASPPASSSTPGARIAVMEEVLCAAR